MKLVKILAVFVPLLVWSHCCGALEWTNNYEAALQKSNETNKPVLLLFTTGGCSWCKKLEREVFNTKEFEERAGSSFVFLHIESKNDRLADTYKIHGYPTVILLDGNEKRILTTGYEGLDGRQYAEYLLKAVSDYNPSAKTSVRTR